MNPLDRLRHHVTGAIERGEAKAIAGIPAPTFSVLPGRDRNGNKTVKVRPHNGARAFTIQTLGNLPATHRDGLGSITLTEVCSHVRLYGTDRQRSALGLEKITPRPSGL